ncbi:MAG: phosphatidylserine decarboxylase [SAR324 cluster bacterium]|nr:phosphatidylserine decarboxylase [SAR324 cluster bacterium]
MIASHSKIGRHFPIGYFLLYLLPKNAFSRFCGLIAELRLPGMVLKPMIRLFVRVFKIDMSEAIDPISAYPTFNAFFTRRLRQETRPIDLRPNVLVSPVDGTIGQVGSIEDGRMIQAKGLDYTISDLLDDPVRADSYLGGHYITLYLAPSNYHRIHSPVSGSIKRCTCIPGQLWTVSPLGVNNVRNLFPRNERIVSYIETDQGECAVVKVGATVVGKVKLAYYSMETNKYNAQRAEVALHQPYKISRGQELGVFELGSTVICCFKPGQVKWGAISKGQTVRLGETLGNFFYNVHSDSGPLDISTST